MATPQQHEDLYWRVRDRLLARHFAVGSRFRTNLHSIDNTLNAGPDSEPLHRWNIASRMRENPLMWSGRLLGAVAAEHQLGHPEAERVLDLALRAIHTLYKVRRGGVFDGYPVRWDAVASDNWTETADTTMAGDFLVDPEPSPRYVYCLPHRDPRYVPKRVPSTLERLLTPDQRAEYDANWWDHFLHHNVWELSMDELVGLTAVYSTAFELVPTATVRSRVVAQVSRLADYLAEHGYLLVRPAGGLNHRGATGVLPALEFPLNRVFQRVTGTSFPARTDFVGAMDKAGYWRVLQLPVDRFAAGVVIGGLVAAPLLATLITAGGVAAPLVHHAVFGLVGGAPAGIGAAAPYVLGAVPRSLGLLNHNDVFEVSEQSEPAVAHLLSAIPATARFHALADCLALLPESAGPTVRGFLPYLGLAAVGDPDRTVAEEYLRLMAERRKGTFHAAKTDGLDGCFASAVALLHGFDRAEEERLVELLDTRHATIAAAGPELLEEVDGVERVEWALDYLIGVSLAWLYAKRRAEAGDPVTTPGFPQPPAARAQWPGVRVPGAVLREFPSVAAVLGVAPDAGDVDLFTGPVTMDKPDEAPLVLPSTADHVEVDRVTRQVRDTDGDVATGIVLEPGDEFEITATGTITAPEFLARPSGPRGWHVVDDARFALHSGLDPDNARKYALLGRIGGYFFVGDRYPRQRFLHRRAMKLYLRVNNDDHTRGAGDGAFTAEIVVWGKRRRRGQLTWFFAPELAEAGQRVTVNLRYRNTGTEPWDGSYRLRLDAPGSAQVWSPADLPLPVAVPPRSTVDVPVTVTAPATAGSFPMAWTLYAGDQPLVGPSPIRSIQVTDGRCVRLRQEIRDLEDQISVLQQDLVGAVGATRASILGQIRRLRAELAGLTDESRTRGCPQ